MARLFVGGSGGDAVVDGLPELLAAGSSGGFDVAEAHPEIGVGVDGDTDKGVAVIDANLGDVAWVVADGDGVPDEWGECWCEVPLTLEVDAIPLHHAALGDRQQQPIEFFETVGHAREPAVGDPGVSR